MKNKNIDVSLVLDSMDLLKGVVNLAEEVESAIAGNDEISEELAANVADDIDDEKLAQAASDAILEVQIEGFMRHVKILKDEVEPNYTEMSCLDDRSLVAFRVPCIVDVKGLLGEELSPEQVEAIDAASNR